jgi:Lamin Tail Domain/Secretion system C-terminal sorting domain
MKKIYLSLLAFLFISIASFAQIRISQVYGGGGNAAATYNQDFVEIFNAGTSTVAIGGWSVQYASATGTSWNVGAITAGATIAAGKYYLVALAIGATGIALPTPDVSITTINLSGTSGKVALVNSTTALSGATACSNASVIDVIGYGAGSCFEGTVLSTTGITNAQSMLRGSNGCTDNNVNNTDFALGTVAPRNSATAANTCGGPVPNITASPNISNLSAAVGSVSNSASFNISASNLTPAAGSLTLTPSSGLEISFDNISFSPAAAQTIAYTGAGIPVTPATPIYVRIAATAPQGAISGNVTCSGGGAASNAVVTVSGGVTQNFFTKSTGDLSMLSTWGTTSADGTGTAPMNFTSPYQIFIVKNRMNAIPGANWEISGAGSKLIIGDGVNPTTVTTSTTDSIKPTTLVDVAALSTLEIGNRVAPTFGTLGTGSTVNYNFNGITTVDTVKVNAANYHHLILKNGLKYFKSGIIGIAGDLIFDGTINSNGAASPFTTLSLKGNLNMTNGALMEDSTTGAGNRLTLSMAGTTPQSISTLGNELSIFRLLRDTTVLTNSDITLAANTKVTVGNNTSGGLSLLQRVGTTPTITKLIMNNNAQVAVVKAGIIFTDPTKAGTINSTNGKIIINKSFIPTTNPGTLKFEPGSSLNTLTVNITTTAKDSLLIANSIEINGSLNLTKGIIVMTGTEMLDITDACMVNGGSVNSFVDGAVRKFFAPTPTTTFLYPVGDARQYAPVELTMATPNNYKVQYFKQPYSTLTVNSATLGTQPGYTISNKEYWDIAQGDLSAPTNIKFYYNTNSLSNASLVNIAHFNGIDWDDVGRSGNGNDAGGNFINNTMINSFSPFTFGGLASTLPIKLSSFNVVKDAKIVNINFASSLEINTKHFVIERSSNAKDWKGIATIAAKGNSNIENTYSTVDFTPLSGINYYRIKTVDNDGKIEYSVIKSVLFGTNFEILVSPNPVKDILNIQIAKKENALVLVTILNAVGGKVFQQRTSNSNFYINASNYAKGTYFVQVTEGENVITKKVVIQ